MLFKYVIPAETQKELKAKHAAIRQEHLKLGEDPALPTVVNVMCRLHEGCPIRDGKPPTIKTCFRHISLPNQFRPKQQNPTDAQLKKAVKEYFEYAGVPGYYESDA